MSFMEELESTIQTAYFEIIKKMRAVQGNNLNCGSFAYIINEIKSVMIQCNRQGYTVLGTTNQIIYELLRKNFFVYKNHVMAAFIGYHYLKKMAQVKTKFSINGINNSSTIQEISNHTITW